MTFADAAEAWLLHAERQRALKPSTLANYRRALDTHLLPDRPDQRSPETVHRRAPFAATSVGEIDSSQLKQWYEGLPSGRTADKLLMIVQAVLGHARSHGPVDAGGDGPIERAEHRRSDGEDFYSPEEIDALVGAAANDQDAAIFLTAALTGLRRRELIALRWGDIDVAGAALRVRANFSNGELLTRKSGKARNARMVPAVAHVLADLSQRELFTSDQEPVFCDTVGAPLEANAVRRRYTRAAKRAGLRPLPFQSLRHCGSMAVDRGSLVEVQPRIGTLPP